MECTSCLAVIPAEARFCGHCGTAVSRPVEAPSDPLRELLRVALGRQYEIIRLLGRGGMGAVYLAKENSLDREVAIKVLPSEQHATPDSRERFRREARTAARLSHPNIVALHTFGDVDGTLYFVMGYVKGESLAEKLRREGRLDIETGRRILIELTEALEYAHGLGIVHRDIKPDNVLIEEGTGRAILTDFGIAKPLSAGETLTVQGSLLGTPHYMSPEQAAGRSDVDHRSDLYSLGVLGYSILAGRLPFEGKTTGDVLMQHITASPPSLKTLAADVPVELSLALTRCLAKEPARRWRDAAELRAELMPPGEDDLPQALSDLREVAVTLLLAPLLALYAFSWFLANGYDPVGVRVALWTCGLALVMPVMILPAKWRTLRRRGYDHSRILRETLLQPKRWIGWYPRRFRVTGDVYDRLPADLRRVRASITTAIVASLIVLIPSFVGMVSHAIRAVSTKSDFPVLLVALILAAGLIPLVTGAFFQLRWRRRARAAGDYDEEIEARMTTASTAPGSFWSKPAVARILLPVAEQASRPLRIPSTASEMVSAISSKASTLVHPARELGERASMAARTLAASLDAFDQEISMLAETTDPGESGRLNGKLQMLASTSSGTGAVKAMLEQQLELVQKLEARLEEAKSERERRAELLKTLWLQVTALAASEGTVRSTDTRERVKALCDEIALHVAHEDSMAATSQLRDDQQETIARNV